LQTRRLARLKPGRSVEQRVTRLGYRLTGSRRLVAQVLTRAREPLTVAQIHRAADGDGPHLASVYRAVHLLTRIGLVRVTDVSRSRSTALYELTEPFTGHHHHLICRRCGRIEDLEGCLVPDGALGRLSRRLGRTRGFQVTEHELRLFGRCRACRP